MKILVRKYLPVLCILVGLSMPQLAVAADNAVGVGVLVNPLGSSKSVFYERMIVPGFSVGGRVSSLSYTYEDGSYTEDGSGTGVEVIASYHFNRKGFTGPYISAGIGQANVDWSWYDYWSTPRSGDGSSNLTSISASFGWDFVMGGGKFVVRPSVMVANYSGTSTDNTGTKNSKIGAVAGAGVSAVFLF